MALAWIPHTEPPRLRDAAQLLAALLERGETALGPVISELEAELARRLSRQWAVAVDSGTSALMLAIRALGLRRVGVPAFACTAVAIAARNAGAAITWLDVDDRLCAQTKAGQPFVLVHPFGYLDPRAERLSGVWIEDVATAAGGRLGNRPCGSFGTLAVGSLYATKPWGGAMGGFVAGDDPELEARVRAMTTTDRDALPDHYAGPHRISAVHAALAWARLERAPEEQRRREALARRLDTAAGGRALALPRLPYRWRVRTEDTEAALGLARKRKIDARRPIRRPLADERNTPNAWKQWRQWVSVPLPAYADEEGARRLEAYVREVVR